MNLNFTQRLFKYEIPIRSVAISSEVLKFSAEILNRNFMNINFTQRLFKYEIPIRSVAISSEVLTLSAEIWIILCQPDKDTLH